jgi:hypothetical protein
LFFVSPEIYPSFNDLLVALRSIDSHFRHIIT